MYTFIIDIEIEMLKQKERGRDNQIKLKVLCYEEQYIVKPRCRKISSHNN